VPAGDYKLDPAHSNLIFRLDHLGFSKYVARFASFDASLHFDPKAPERATIQATVDPASLTVATPPEGFLDDLRGPQWLDTKQFSAITFKSTKVETTGARTARITGDLTLHGVIKPLVLEATFNGGYAGLPMDPHARVGFSATGTFKRSDYGMGFGIPAPGTTMGVGDTVDISIESEFTGPPLATSAG
jgi:polyisoprenoid-binding protein YceI